MKRSKAYRKADELIDPSKLYTPVQAVSLAKQMSGTKFDPTVEVALRLGVDPRKADHMVRGTVNLPHGTGKTPASWCSRRETGRKRPRQPARTTSVPTT